MLSTFNITIDIFLCEIVILFIFSQRKLFTTCHLRNYCRLYLGICIVFSTYDNDVFLTFTIVYFVVCSLALFSLSVVGDKVTIFLNSEFQIEILLDRIKKIVKFN
jgi:hypothetical protein